MVPTLPSQITAPVLDRSAFDVPARRDDLSWLRDDEPPIERPAANSTLRAFVTAALIFALVLVVGVPMLRAIDDQTLRDDAWRAVGWLLLASYVCSTIGFALWTHRKRVAIDGLRWRAFRRPIWSGRWAALWIETTLVVALVATAVSLFTSNRVWLLAFGPLVVAVRLLALRELGINMARVVPGAKRWLRIWGVAIGCVDVLVADVFVSAVVDNRPDVERLEPLTAFLVVPFLVAALATVAYMKRSERWILEWFDQRHGVSDDEIAAVLGSMKRVDPQPADFRRRWLLPMLPLRAMVAASYAVVVAAMLWVGWVVLDGGDVLPLASGTDAALAGFDRAVIVALVTLAVLQIVHGLWSVVQVANARRCTVNVPSPIGLFGLLLVGPGLAVAGTVFFDDPDVRLAAYGIAGLVNLLCWGVSFSLMGETMRALGRSGETISTWFAVLAVHVVLGFLARPVDTIDSDALLATAVLGFVVIEAVIFATAGAVAWRAMRQVDTATHEFEQVRRVSV